MNMPTTILSSEGLIENTYSWDGSKRRRRVLDQIGQQLSDERYLGDLVTENGLPSLILHADGYVDVSGMQPVFIYHLKDHLGNVRIVLQAGGSSGTLKQSNDYYPFGMAYTKNAADSEEDSFAHENKYKYNDKEEQPMPGKWLDYGARFYDAQLGRWHSIDPLAEAFISFTPYHYVRNNPVKLYDINGMGDNDWFDKQQEIDANYNAQNDAMFNSIMTGPALGKTQTVKNTDEKKKTEVKKKADEIKKKNQDALEWYNSLSYFQRQLVNMLINGVGSINYWSDFLGGPTGEGVSLADKMEYHILVYSTGKFLIVTSRGINPVKSKIKIPDGYTEVTGVKSKGQPVFRKGNRYITPDIDSHKGGKWKMAGSPKNLGSKEKRIGTFNEELNVKVDR